MPPRDKIDITDFPGIIESVDPRDLPPGAAEEQINACCIVVGELTVRRGIQEVTFEA